MAVVPNAVEWYYRKARELVLERAKGRCEACNRRLSIDTMQFSHRKPRSAGRNDDPSNGLCLCFACHSAVHHRPAWARDVGWAISRYDPRAPHEIPVALQGRWFLLPQGGGPATLTENPKHPVAERGNDGDLQP